MHYAVGGGVCGSAVGVDELGARDRSELLGTPELTFWPSLTMRCAIQVMPRGEPTWTDDSLLRVVAASSG